MRTLNEQIQRLRDALVTCYNAIKRKGGAIPEEGLRNMSNLPAAVLSIPQTHGVLTELEVTANGEYLPEEGVDGFSKVTARFDTSSLPKPKVSSLSVNNDCVDENGHWDGRGVDVSNVTLLNQVFYNNANLKSVDIKEWDVSNVTSLGSMFMRCRLLESVDLSGWNTSKITIVGSLFQDCNALKSVNLDGWDVSSLTTIAQLFQNCFALEKIDLHDWVTNKITSLYYLFYSCSKLKWLDITGWDVSSVTNCNGFISESRAIETFVGDRTIEDVISNNITCLGGLKVNLFLGQQRNLNRASLRAIINGLADLTGQSTQTLEMQPVNVAKLTEEDIAVATNKNWTIA